MVKYTRKNLKKKGGKTLKKRGGWLFWKDPNNPNEEWGIPKIFSPKTPGDEIEDLQKNIENLKEQQNKCTTEIQPKIDKIQELIDQKQSSSSQSQQPAESQQYQEDPSQQDPSQQPRQQMGGRRKKRRSKRRKSRK